ncbi:hypothetical protein BGZ88_004194 [Linnemannia elongata]|nr:hypothetical protein BGZ88_004194 [Linnemannia elongata]
MGVFGEKHTSLTREQKRQLIHQADTHKLRPTEVCDWVLATWGLRIARVTVYSILHKQRASLMAGHKDLYQSMQNSVHALQQSSSNASSSSSSTNTYSVTEDACLERDPTTGRINKYQTTTATGKRARSTSSSARSSSVMPDFSSMPPVPSGEGARWEGQLKRVREPASVELDRAMVQFLKSSAAVDEHGRRLNDAELQSHALRLARGIPSASRMRCSFGWLRHFKRRLGVQWAADRLGRHRWIVEMDPFGSSSVSASSETALPSSPLVSTLSSSTSVSSTPTQTSADVAQPLVGPSSSALNRSRRQGKVAKHEHGNNNNNTQSSQSHATPDQFTNNGGSSNEDNDDDDDEEEYHSSHELLGKEHDFTSPIPSSTTAINNNTIPFLASAKHTRSTSTSTSASTTSTSATAYSHGSTLRHHAQTPLSNLDLHQQQHQQQQHRLYSFGGNGSESSSFSSLGHFPSLHPSLASHSGLLNSYSTSIPSTTTPTHSHPTQHAHSHTSSILDSFPNLFDSLPPLHSPSSTIPTSTFSSSQLFLNQTSASIDTTSHKPTTTPSRMDASNPFGMNIDGGMRKVPSKDEAYDMLQSLLLYYEQDHHYIGEQQTLLLPRWIHQQRQIMSQSDESDPRLYPFLVVEYFFPGAASTVGPVTLASSF